QHEQQQHDDGHRRRIEQAEPAPSPARPAPGEGSRPDAARRAGECCDHAQPPEDSDSVMLGLCLASASAGLPEPNTASTSVAVQGPLGSLNVLPKFTEIGVWPLLASWLNTPSRGSCLA